MKIRLYGLKDIVKASRSGGNERGRDTLGNQYNPAESRPVTGSTCSLSAKGRAAEQLSVGSFVTHISRYSKVVLHLLVTLPFIDQQTE